MVAADAADFEEKGRGSAAGCVEGLYSLRSGGNGPSGRGWRIALTGNAYEVSVTDLPFCIIRYDNHSADWLAALATPLSGCAGLLHGRGGGVSHQRGGIAFPRPSGRL